MRLSIVEGEAGCKLAVERFAVAIVVDALRASATAAALLAEGAGETCVVREVEAAHALKQVWPDALLFGERGGLPPEGFDFGNSPREAGHARGRRVIFTTTTGAGRMLAAWGAHTVCMGSVVNRAAVVAFMERLRPAEIVLIPAGLANDPHFDAQEDWAAAVWIASHMLQHCAHTGSITWGEGFDQYTRYNRRIEDSGLDLLFQEAPHADKLRAVGMAEDIALCARRDIYTSVPVATAPFHEGLLIRDGSVR